MLKRGDIVYFREEHQVHYTTTEHRSGRFFLERGPWILVEVPHSGTCVIKSPITGESHFMFSSSGGGFQKLVSIEKWREMQLNICLKEEI
jgi:hypothetical protein